MTSRMRRRTTLRTTRRTTSVACDPGRTDSCSQLRANSQAPSAGVPAGEADLHVVPDHLGVLQEPLRGELIETPTDNGGSLGLVGPESLGRLSLGELLLVDCGGDLGGELGLRERLF